MEAVVLETKDLAWEQKEAVEHWLYFFNLYENEKLHNSFFYCEHPDTSVPVVRVMHQLDGNLVVEDPDTLEAARHIERFLRHPNARKLLWKFYNAYSSLLDAYADILLAAWKMNRTEDKNATDEGVRHELCAAQDH